MNRLFIALSLFVLFMLMAIISTAVTYWMVYVAACWACIGWFEGNNVWFPAAIITLVTFVVSLIASIRKKTVSINRISWDSGFVMASPSSGKNANPLGPQSVASIAAIGAGLLCFGPGCIVAAFEAARDELTNRA